MGDGRTDLFRNMWTRTTTNDGMVNSPEEFKKKWKQAQEQQYLDLEYMPDQKMHRNVSFVKSGFRLVGAGLGMLGYLPAAFALLFLAEIVGIYEELV